MFAKRSPRGGGGAAEREPAPQVIGQPAAATQPWPHERPGAARVWFVTLRFAMQGLSFPPCYCPGCIGDQIGTKENSILSSLSLALSLLSGTHLPDLKTF